MLIEFLLRLAYFHPLPILLPFSHSQYFFLVFFSYFLISLAGSMSISLIVLKSNFWGIPGGAVVRTRHFHCQGPGLIPDQGTKTPQARQHSQKNK